MESRVAESLPQEYEQSSLPGLESYRASQSEKARTADLLRLLPKGRRSVLDIGARDGHFSQLLSEHFVEVTALDLKKPDFEFARVTAVAGDVTKLPFDADSFDSVFCAEVLEHVPDVQKACEEIIRVAKYDVIVGVPFKQDIRCGRTTCRSCGKANPPWGHVNSFDEARLMRLFSGLQVVSKSFVGSTNETSNSVSAFLMDLAGNQWGTYEQEEPCVFCGASLIAPEGMRTWQRVCSAVAARINRLQARWTPSHGNWIHLVFSKRA